MKKMIHKLNLVFLLLCSTLTAQIDYGNQIGKKEVKKGEVTFVQNTSDAGNTTHGFTMDGLPVGGQMQTTIEGNTIYQTYNTKHQLDGTVIIMSRNSGDTEMYTYRKNQKNGPAFKITNGNVAWQRQYKNDVPTGKDYEVNHSADFYTDRNSPTFEGFTIEKYKGSYALGFFAYSKRAYPIIHVWDSGSSFYGQCIQGVRKEFGVYFYEDGSKYIGAWHNNKREGLGFKLDSGGMVIEKGYYKKGSLEIEI